MDFISQLRTWCHSSSQEADRWSYR